MKLYKETWGKTEWVPVLPLAQHSCAHNQDPIEQEVGFMFETMLLNEDRALLIHTSEYFLQANMLYMPKKMQWQ